MAKEEQFATAVGEPVHESKEQTNGAKCPYTAGVRQQAVTGSRSNADWWPNQLNVRILHQHSSLSDPMGEAFNYAEEFKTLDLNAVIKDLHELMTSS